MASSIPSCHIQKMLVNIYTRKQRHPRKSRQVFLFLISPSLICQQMWILRYHSNTISELSLVIKFASWIKKHDTCLFVKRCLLIFIELFLVDEFSKILNTFVLSWSLEDHFICADIFQIVHIHFH